MAGDPRIGYITQRAQQLGLDPEAVLAIAGHEGLSGAIGDGGHAFGPFQMNDAGGVLTGKTKGQTPQESNAWAWSHAGIDHALTGIAGVARGLKGRAAIEAIATKYERPANPGAEISDAWAHYGHYGAGSGNGAASSVTPQEPSSAPQGSRAGGSLSRQQLAQIVFGAGHVDFGSNQAQAPNLMALAQARAQMAQNGAAPQAASAPNAPPASAGSASGGGIAKTALSQIGIPYKWGGEAKLGGQTDCSGLLQASARANGVKDIGRTTYQQWTQGSSVPLNALQPGDAVFFHPGPKGPEHVAIYIGGGKVVEDPHTGASVEISQLAGRGAMGARRY